MAKIKSASRIVLNKNLLEKIEFNQIFIEHRNVMPLIFTLLSTTKEKTLKLNETIALPHMRTIFFKAFISLQ